MIIHNFVTVVAHHCDGELEVHHYRGVTVNAAIAAAEQEVLHEQEAATDFYLDFTFTSDTGIVQREEEHFPLNTV